MGEIRFGVLAMQDAGFDELVARWQLIEETGFDQIFVADHTADYRNQDGVWWDGWTALTVLAQATRTVRVGTLVTNPVIRPPILTAKAAATVDHLSGGRLELGIGTGIAGFDHAAAGVPYWSPKERAAHYAEYVTVVEGLLESHEQPFGFHGEFYAVHETSLTPPPAQPRIPIIAAGQSPTVRRVAATQADAWNTHGPFGASASEIVAVTRKQNIELDEWCGEARRDPTDLRRSVFLFDSTDPWAAPGRFEELVHEFLDAGMREFVVSWPETAEQRRWFDEAVTNVIPPLRDRRP